jgi:hypothetical protein
MQQVLMLLPVTIEVGHVQELMCSSRVNYPSELSIQGSLGGCWHVSWQVFGHILSPNVCIWQHVAHQARHHTQPDTFVVWTECSNIAGHALHCVERQLRVLAHDVSCQLGVSDRALHSMIQPHSFIVCVSHSNAAQDIYSSGCQWTVNFTFGYCATEK